MNIFEPNIQYRYSVKDVLASFESAEAAFLAGNYIAALRLCDLEQDVELSGCAYIMAGHVSKGIEILKALSGLSHRSQFYLAFAYWVEGNKNLAINIVEELIQTEPENAHYLKFKALLDKQCIHILLFGHLTEQTTKQLLKSVKQSKPAEFSIKTVGYSNYDDIYIEHDSDIQQVLTSLPVDEYPDIALFISPYGIFHKNYQDLPIPKLIFMLDHDYFTHNYGGIIKNDIVVTTGPVEHFEINHFYSLPCHTFYNYDMSEELINEDVLDTKNSDQYEFNQTKKYDIVLTGSIFNNFQRQKGQLIFKIIHMPEEWKIKVVDGFLSVSQYYDMLKQSKFTFASVRFIDVLQQRSVDALNNGCIPLYSEQASCHLFIENDLMKPHSENFLSLKQQLTDYLNEPSTFNPIAVANLEHIFKKPPARELHQLKYFSFVSIFKQNNPKELQRKQSLKETTGSIGFEMWTEKSFTSTMDSLKNHLHGVSQKTEYHYIKLFNLYVYEGGTQQARVGRTVEERRIELLHAHRIGRKGLKQFPMSLTLRFNLARFYFFTGMTDNALSEFLKIVHSAHQLTYFELTADIFHFFFPKKVFSTLNDELEDTLFFPQLSYSDNVIIKYVNLHVRPDLQKPFFEPKNIILSSCHYFIAKIYYKEDDLQKSLKHLYHALDLYPDNYVVQHFLVQILTKLPVSLQHRKEIFTKIIHFYILALRHYPAFIQQETFVYAIQAAHNLGRKEIVDQLLNSWFLFYKRVFPTNGKLTFSTKTINVILKYAPHYPNSSIHLFLNKNFIDIDNKQSFSLKSGEEQLIYPFFKRYLSFYVNRQDFDTVILLLHKLLSTPNMDFKNQTIHSSINFLITQNIQSPELDRLVERLVDNVEVSKSFE